jgi:hypothetical protein
VDVPSNAKAGLTPFIGIQRQDGVNLFPGIMKFPISWQEKFAALSAFLIPVNNSQGCGAAFVTGGSKWTTFSPGLA